MTSHQKLEDHVTPGKYDAVLRVDLFTDVYDWNRGWKMAVNPTSRDALELCTAVRVAPIGVFNAGKTWLIKKLCGDGAAGLVSAADAHTEGLSVKISNLSNDVRTACFLDTAGLNSPVTSVTALGRMLGNTSMDGMKAMEEMLQELKRQENFIRQVAFEFAQVYLLVIGQISHRDQLELLQLVDLAQRVSGTKKHVIVVHNLKSMTYEEFCSKEIDAQTNMSYRDCMSKVFGLSGLQQHVFVGREESYVDELHSTFGDPANAVQIRHVFLTKEELDSHGKPKDTKCKNHFVVERIRQLIQAVVPTTGDVLRDIAKIASGCAKNMVRLPPGKVIDIRYHEARTVLLGGEMIASEVEAAKARAAKANTSDEVLEFLSRLEAKLTTLNNPDATEDERKQLEALETELALKRVEVLAKMKTEEVDAKTLIPLKDAIMARPIALGAVTATNGDGHVKFNVSRTRSMVQGQPFWTVWVHMTVPALAPGQLGRLKGELQWDRGVTMEGLTPQSPESLKIRFKARVLPMPVKQLASLNLHGCPPVAANLRAIGGAITIDTKVPPVIVEAGNRPFPTAEATYGAAKEGMREDGSYELDVVVHTKVENCVWDVPPVLHYSRGVLSLMVCAEPTEEELRAPANETWVNEAGSVFVDLGSEPAEQTLAIAADDLADEPAVEPPLNSES